MQHLCAQRTIFIWPWNRRVEFSFFFFFCVCEALVTPGLVLEAKQEENVVFYEIKFTKYYLELKKSPRAT